MDETQPAGGRRRTTAIIAAAGLACLAIAIPVSGAFGAGEGNDGPAAQSQQGYGPQGYGPPPATDGQGRPDRDGDGPHRNCPKHQGAGQGQSQGGSSNDTYAPGVPGDSVEL